MKKHILSVMIVIVILILMSSVSAMDAIFDQESSQIRISGKLDKEYAGKYVSLCMANKNDPKDIGWIGQTEVKADGSYDFRFEFSKKVSDYTVTVNQNNEILTPSIADASAVTSLYKVKAEGTFDVNKVTVSISVSDFRDSGSKKCTLIVVGYDAGGCMTDVKVLPDLTTDGLAEKKDFTFDVNKNVEYAKVMLWESLDSLMPYDGSSTISRHKYDEYITRRGDIGNIFKKLDTEKQAVIGFFGGSVTQGTGLETEREDIDSWRGLVGEWFKTQYKDADITLVNAAIGSSGSNLADYRLQKDILSKNPDMVFIMFFINDVYCNDGSYTTSYVTSVIEKIRKANPDCDIVMLFETDKYVNDYLKEGTNMHEIAWLQDKVADYYDVTTINMGRAMQDYIRAMPGGINGNWSKYFTDNVHPTQLGYSFYAEVIKEYLSNEKRNVIEGSETEKHQLPETPYVAYKPTTMVEADDIQLTENTGWSKGDAKAQIGSFSRALTSKNLNDCFVFDFEGSELSIFMYGGDFSYSIDGGELKKCDANQNRPKNIVRSLEPGKHSVKIVNTSGSNIDIYAMLYR